MLHTWPISSWCSGQEDRNPDARIANLKSKAQLLLPS